VPTPARPSTLVSGLASAQLRVDRLSAENREMRFTIEALQRSNDQLRAELAAAQAAVEAAAAKASAGRQARTTSRARTVSTASVAGVGVAAAAGLARRKGRRCAEPVAAVAGRLAVGGLLLLGRLWQPRADRQRRQHATAGRSVAAAGAVGTAGGGGRRRAAVARPRGDVAPGASAAMKIRDGYAMLTGWIAAAASSYSAGWRNRAGGEPGCQRGEVAGGRAQECRRGAGRPAGAWGETRRGANPRAGPRLSSLSQVAALASLESVADRQLLEQELRTRRVVELEELLDEARDQIQWLQRSLDPAEQRREQVRLGTALEELQEAQRQVRRAAQAGSWRVVIFYYSHAL